MEQRKPRSGDEHPHRKLARADEELAGYYSAAIGVHAQSYETGSSMFNPHAAHSSRLEAMRWLAPRPREDRPRPRGAREWFDEVSSSLNQLGRNDRRTIELIYAYGTDAMADGDTLRETADVNDEPCAPRDALGLLKLALGPTWGHGSYLRIAVDQPRALRAFEKHRPGITPNAGLMLEFLAFQAGKGQAAADFLKRIRDQCEAERESVLRLYDPLRAQRMKELVARDDRELAEKKRQNAERLAQLLGQKRARERRRFEQRMRGSP